MGQLAWVRQDVTHPSQQRAPLEQGHVSMGVDHQPRPRCPPWLQQRDPGEAAQTPGSEG